MLAPLKRKVKQVISNGLFDSQPNSLPVIALKRRQRNGLVDGLHRMTIWSIAPTVYRDLDAVGCRHRLIGPLHHSPTRTLNAPVDLLLGKRTCG